MKRTTDKWLRLFDEDRRQFLPTFHISLMLDDNKMQLYPNADDVLQLVTYAVEEAANTFQSVSDDHTIVVCTRQVVPSPRPLSRRR